jgi:Secretion system C-terminal sorting domain
VQEAAQLRLPQHPCATSYSWTPGSFTTNIITVAPANTTTYTLIRANGACSFTSNITLTVNALPGIIALSGTPNICSNNTTSLTAAGATTYTWKPSITTLTGNVVFVTPIAIAVPTVITYTVTGANATCTNVATAQLTVNPNPTISIAASPSSVICRDQTVTLTANNPTASPIAGYAWTSVAITGTNQIAVTPTATTAYPLVVLNSFSCSATATQVIVVNILPALTATTTASLVCTNGQANSQSTIGVNVTNSVAASTTYSWSTGAPTRTTLVTPGTTKIYTVTGTFTSTQCKSTQTIQITVFTPTVTITGDTATCFGGGITLTGNNLPAGGTYTWNGNYPFQNFTASPTLATVYQVAGRTTSNNVSCVNTASVLITIYSNPTISAVSQPSAICRGEVSALTGSGAATYVWTGPQSGVTVSVTPTTQTTFTVIGTDVNGCNDTTTVLVKVSLCTGIQENGLGYEVVNIYPNPNNGEFVISSDIEIDLTLVNSLGQLIKKVKLADTKANKVSWNDLPGGIYYLVGEKSGVRINQKVIINK